MSSVYDDNTAASPIDDDQNRKNKHYKIRLASGRVLGPLDIERIKQFILKNKIGGNEVAREYPTGTWKDINQFPELAELFLLNLEGRLKVEAPSSPNEPDDALSEDDSNKPSSEPIENTLTPVVKKSTRSIVQDKLIETSPPLPNRDEEGTMVISRDTEGTVVVDTNALTSDADQGQPPLDEQVSPEQDAAGEATPDMSSGELDQVKYTSLADIADAGGVGNISKEKTVMFQAPPKSGSKDASDKRGLLKNPKVKIALVLIAVVLGAMEILAPTKRPKKSEEVLSGFVVAFPVVDKSKIDPQKSEIVYKSGLSYYNLDTVDGYKKAAIHFSKAVTMNGQNVKAIALLASSYINLFDVVTKDEKYFQVVTGLVEAARAKQVDVPELVITDVELYNLMSNPEAAIARLDSFSKQQLSGSNQFPAELFYYLAQSYYVRGRYDDALKNLQLMPETSWFSARIPYLYGQIFYKLGQTDNAIAALEKVIKLSPNHIKARVLLSKSLIKKDSIAAAGTQAEYVINHSDYAAPEELSQALYIRGRMYASVQKNVLALQDLAQAKKLNPTNIDILYEFYTIKARVTKESNESQNKVKVYELLAMGENAMRKGDLQNALKSFLEARRIDDKNIQPLIRMSEVFKRQGNYVAAISSYEKAIKIAPGDTDLYPEYIKLAIESYEYVAAKKAIEKFIQLSKSVSVSQIDALYGQLYYKSESFDEALVYLKRALQGASLDVNIYIYYADILMMGQRYADAAFYYGLAKRVDPVNIQAQIGIAKALSETENVEKAVRLLESDPLIQYHRAEILTGVAEIYLRKNNSSDALKYIELAVEADKKFAKAYKIKGDVLQSMEKFKDAETVYKTYQSMNPNDPQSYIERYRMSMKRSDYVGARKEIVALLERFPKFPGGHYMLGDVALQAQNAKEAYREAMLELTNNPNHIPGLVLAGNALNMAKEFVPALEKFNMALALNPGYVPALIGAGYANHMLKTYPAAQTLLERAAKIDPGNPAIRKRLGSLYFDMGNKAQSVESFKAYLDLYPDAPDRAEIESFIR